MGSADNHEAFTYYISQLNKYDLAFVHVMDGLGFGYHNLCKQFKLADARKVFDGTIIGNVGYTKLTAEGAINTGAADLIAFGRDWISNPDLPARYENDWPLTPADNATWWMYPGFPEGDVTVGYSNFTNYTPVEKEIAV
jgi:N-ethylmaleimide reductase